MECAVQLCRCLFEYFITCGLVSNSIMDVDLSSDFRERNLENLVNFYEDGLRRVASGERASEVFSHQERGKLRAAGILRYGNLHWGITVEAKEYLEKMGG